MTEKNQDFDMTGGDDKEIIVSVVDQDGAPKDLTDATAKWALATRSGSIAVSKATGGSGITIPVPSNGQVHILLESADTASLAGSYLHECEVTDADGDSETVATGTVTIYKTIIASL